MSHFFEVGKDRLDGPPATVYGDWLVSWGFRTPTDSLQWKDLVTTYAASDWSTGDRWSNPFKASDGSSADRARGWAPSLYWEVRFSENVLARRAMLSV